MDSLGFFTEGADKLALLRKVELDSLGFVGLLWRAATEPHDLSASQPAAALLVALYVMAGKPTELLNQAVALESAQGSVSMIQASLQQGWRTRQISAHERSNRGSPLELTIEVPPGAYLV